MQSMIIVNNVYISSCECIGIGGSESALISVANGNKEAPKKTRPSFDLKQRSSPCFIFRYQATCLFRRNNFQIT